MTVARQRLPLFRLLSLPGALALLLSACGSGSAGTTSAAAVTMPTVTLSASPTSTAAGTSSTLTWSSTEATSCMASGAWSGVQPTAGSASVAPTATGTYTLACTNAAGTATGNATVTVASGVTPTVSLTALPTSIAAGGTSTLTWSSADATSCIASGAWSGSQATAGTMSVSPTTNGTYTLQCTGAGGTGSISATVTVATAAAPTPTVTIAASPAAIAAGGKSTLTWSSTNATSCAASGAWSGTQPTAGSLSVAPTANATYTLACTGTGGSGTSSATVTVGAATTPTPTVSLAANPGSMSAGGTSTLTWTSTNATGCTASGAWSGTKAASGSASVTPTATGTYSLACTGGGGTGSGSATITVVPAAPTVYLTASPGAIAAGAASTLTWSSTNATACTASGAWSGAKATSGSASVTPTASGTYALACTGAGGSGSSSASITVAPPTTAAATGGTNFTSAPALAGVTVTAGRDSVIVQVPAVANARDFRVIVAPTSVVGNVDGTETVVGGTQFCAGVLQHQSRARYVADKATLFPYSFYLNGEVNPTSFVPQFFVAPTTPWSVVDLDTPPVQQIEVTGVTAAMTVTVEAIDRLCPFPGIIGRTAQDITLTHGPDVDHPGNPWIDATAVKTFPVVTKAMVVARYGSLIVNGQGWAGGPNVQAIPPTNPTFAQPAPVNPPIVLARATVTVAPLATPPAAPADFFDDFANASDTLQPIAIPKWTYPRYQAGQLVLQNSKWTVYGNGFTCCSATAPQDGKGYADAFIDNGSMNTILGDWGQDVLSEITMVPRKAAHLNGTSYLHVTFEVPSFATARRYWVFTACGSGTPGQTLDTTGALKEQVVHTTFFYQNTGMNPSTAGWNCLQIFNRQGNSNAQSRWDQMYNLNGSRPAAPTNGGANDIADYIHTSVPSIANPAATAAYITHPESDVVVLVNKPIPAANLPEVGGTNEQVVHSAVTSPINVSPLQLDNPAGEVAWFYRVDANGNPVAPILDDQQLVSPRTHYDLYIRNNRIIMYVNGQARLCNDFTTPTTTLNIADAALGFHQVLYHSSGEFVERFNDPDRGAAFQYRYNSPWIDQRSWDNIGFEENTAAPADFNPGTCFVHKSLGAENNEP